jgi:poly-gamma-glutamate synthesis protein (capsule biosynthesis protein)
LNGADAGFANREGNVFDLRTFKGWPASENGGFEQLGVGSGPLAAAATAHTLKELGIQLLALANNHSTDWGLEGLAETERVLDEAGVVHAGSGSSRAAARAAAFLATRKGRVAFLSAASTFLPLSVAGPGEGERAPRPGISALRVKPITLVSAAEMSALREIAKREGHVPANNDQDITLDPNDQTFNDQTFRVGSGTGIQYEVNSVDREEILKAIHAGKKAADFAVFTIHAHETASGGQEYAVPPETLAPADFLRPLFHDAIDAGADVVVTTGPHVLRGIEIYKGKPIFYGLGSLFFELGRGWPASWYDSVLAISEYRNGQLFQLRLYPLDLGGPSTPERSRTQQGIPHLAGPSDAKRILQALQQASAPYGTEIRIENNVGLIRIAAPH